MLHRVAACSKSVRSVFYPSYGRLKHRAVGRAQTLLQKYTDAIGSCPSVRI